MRLNISIGFLLSSTQKCAYNSAKNHKCIQHIKWPAETFFFYLTMASSMLLGREAQIHLPVKSFLFYDKKMARYGRNKR